jgi:LuxR family transcriptional regulator, maltose regulon positive regulatory protein
MAAIADGDYEQARIQLEDAADLYDRSGTPYEAARARLELAGVLIELDRPRRAFVDAEKAHRALERLGSRFHARRAQMLLKDIEQRRGAKAAANGSALTPRQTEILRLVAAGESDRGIAAALGLSEYTVHRHVANILLRLALPNRAAAVAHAIARKLI